MNTSASTPLFACSRCFSRHPFEELSPGEQLCKECRGSFPVVKCTYCRSEFQQSSKSSTSSICKKCDANVKAYGKPTACEYCNIIAAFIGNKCHRCAHSERRYGAAVTCEQCKQRCAFDRHDDNKKVEGKLLCWLCTQSLKRALARTKQQRLTPATPLDKHRHRHYKSRNQHKERRKSDLMKSASDISLNDSQPLEKKSKSNPAQGEVDPNSSDHVVAMTQLKETIASLQKRVSQKDNELLAKDRMITELKAQNLTATTELRTEMKNKERMHETKYGLMNSRIQNLLKEVATLSRSAKKNNKGGNKCHRCAHSERRYGAAVTCEQCKQRCAFDRHDDNKKVEGKLLCWLCTQSLKRALARTKQQRLTPATPLDKHRHRHYKSRNQHKERRKSDLMKSASDISLNDSQPLEKKSKSNPAQGEVDPNSSDHVVAMTQLKETIASLQKRVSQKDNELLAKDRMITELKAQNLTATTELRTEMKNKERMHETKYGLMNSRIQNLLKEVATLSRSAKKNNKGGKAGLLAAAAAAARDSGSGTDSPSTN